MSSMLEQAIVDAAALREAALKNAEQSIIEKYAPQIKEAVDSLLDKDVLQEQDLGAASTEETSGIMAPLNASPVTDPNQEVTLKLTDDDQVYVFDLNQLRQDSGEGEEQGLGAEEAETTEDLMGDLGLETPEQEAGEEGEDLLNEIMEILSEVGDEEEVIEEELIVDMAGQHKNGTIETNEATLQYQQEMQLAKEEATKQKEENEELEKKNKELSESLKSVSEKNKKLLEIINKLDNSLNETLLSNAKLLYSNHTLSDASLNERQKSKIVEAIAKAKTPEEAKNLQEALKTTVGTTKNDGPKSLSESVSRKSNLSGIMPRRKQPEQEFTFADKMKKLAGIK
jgi:hypothetical protein